MPKPKEVEIRILLKNRKEIEDKLEHKGAKIVYFSRLKDYWYCPKNVKNFKDASIDKTSFALRIRESQDLYTGKKIASLDCKTLCDGKTHALCNEYEINLQDTNQARKILESIGLKEFLLVDKERTIFKHKNIKFCFDKIKGVGDGLEIEIMAKRDINKTHEKLVKLALELGIGEDEILEKSLTYIAMEKISRF